jgi:N-acetylglucosaminyl-diphospho-decaprenol L-rhamnosyltransferase
MPEPTVSLITVSYFSGDHLSRLMEGLFAQGEDSGALEVVVVCNSAERYSWAGLRSVRVIDSGKNCGFSAACNRGAARAKGRYLLFCNPDVQMTQEVIRGLVGVLESRPELSCVAPFTGGHRIICQPDGTYHEFPGRTCGACFVVSRETFWKLGGWDESFFIWWEDFELLVRMTRAGLRYGFAHQIVVPHVNGHSTTGDRHVTREVLTRVWIASHANYLVKTRGVWSALGWCSVCAAVNLTRAITGRSLKGRRYYRPSEAVRFALKVLGNAWRLRRYVSFDGDGFPWNRTLARDTYG